MWLHRMQAARLLRCLLSLPHCMLTLPQDTAAVALQALLQAACMCRMQRHPTSRGAPCEHAHRLYSPPRHAHPPASHHLRLGLNTLNTLNLWSMAQDVDEKDLEARRGNDTHLTDPVRLCLVSKP